MALCASLAVSLHDDCWYIRTFKLKYLHLEECHGLVIVCITKGVKCVLSVKFCTTPLVKYCSCQFGNIVCTYHYSDFCVEELVGAVY